MGIDRPDEDTAPDVRPDSPTAGHDARATAGDSPTDGQNYIGDSEADRAAYALKHREKVEAEYLAAWDEAAPAFRETLEDHERQNPYPERSRPTVGDDGSWRTSDRLKLSPPQNAEVDRGGERIREIGERTIIPAMRAAAAEDTSRHLVGFEHCFKGADRLKEKVADRLRSKPGHTPTEILEGIPDSVRFTLQYPHNSYLDGVQRDIERLEARGFIQIERRNTWTSEQYKGINSRWREPESGLQFEVQFHTRISFEAKELTHKAYERIRSSAKDPERAVLQEFQRTVCAMIPLPPGVTEYEDYSPERRDD